MAVRPAVAARAMALRLVALGLVALGLVAPGFALAATLASALAAAAAFSACAVNVRKFLNLEITHFYSPVTNASTFSSRLIPRERQSMAHASFDHAFCASFKRINH